MKALKILEILREINKPFYTISDLEKITGLDRKSLYVALNRWTKMKVLERIGKGLYIPYGNEVLIEKVASQIYYPSYLSFEYALAKYGILNLIPYTLTFATFRKTRRYTIAGRDIEYRQIKKELFWGYIYKKGVYIAEKEKAFLDQIYLFKKGMATIEIDELNLKSLSKKVLFKYAERFPPFVKEFLNQVIVL